jgi:hypothetical protein
MVVLALIVSALVFRCQEFTNGIAGGICYSYGHLFEQFRDKCVCFPMYVNFAHGPIFRLVLFTSSWRLLPSFETGLITIVLQYALNGMLFYHSIVMAQIVRVQPVYEEPDGSLFMLGGGGGGVSARVGGDNGICGCWFSIDTE